MELLLRKNIRNIFILYKHISSLFDYIARPVFNLDINPANVLAKNPDTDQLDATQNKTDTSREG